jgi:WD40 repeat protein
VAVENAIAFQEIEALKDQLAEENAYLKEEVRTEHNFGELIGESAALRRVLKEAETVAPTGSTVLIRGESGTGKELIARALHDLSLWLSTPGRRTTSFGFGNCWTAIGPAPARPTCAVLNGTISTDCFIAISTVKAHVGYAMMVAYTPDGKKLLSFGSTQPPLAGEYFESQPGELKLWDAATRKELPLPHNVPADRVTCTALSPDGKRLAACCRDKIVRVWNVDTGELITLEGHKQGHFLRVGFSHDGNRLVSLAADFGDLELGGAIDSGEMKVWDLTTREAIVSPPKLPYALSSAISPDGKLVALSPFQSAVVRLWDTTTGRELPCLKDAGVWAYALAFSPDGKRLAASGLNDVKIWDVATGKILVTCQGASDEFFGLAFSPDGKSLATATGQGLVELWDAATGHRVRTFKGHSGMVSSVAFSPDGTHLASAGADGTLKVWETKNEPDALLIPMPSLGAEVLLSPDCQTVLTSLKEKPIQLWNAVTGEPRGVTIEPPHPFFHYDITPDCKRMPMAGTNNQVTIWDLETGKAVRIIQGRVEPITDVAISPDGKLLAILGKGRTISLWDIDKGVELCTIQGLKQDLTGLTFSPDGARLVGVNHSGGTVMVFDVSTGREMLTISLSDFGIQSVRVSPDGKRLAVAGFAGRFHTGEVRVFALESGREIVPPLRGHSLPVQMVAFSPDGQRLAGGGVDKTVKIWDLTTGQEILMLKGHTSKITSLHFVSEGRRLMSTDLDGTVRTWDATPLPDDR